MYDRRCLARLAAATTATALMTLGGFVPAYGGGGAGNGNAADAEGTAQSEGSHGAEVSAQARAEAGGAADASSGAKASTSTKASTKGPDHSKGNASTTGVYNQPQPESNADQNDVGANAGSCSGTNPHPYCSTRDGSASENGKGDGVAKGKPCAGCVGKADNKNPPGQYPDGSDHNAGYECDRNQGIGKTNPAHTGCVTEEKPPPVKPPVKPPEKPEKPEKPPVPPTPPTPPTPSAPPAPPAPRPPAVVPEQPAPEVPAVAPPAPAPAAVAPSAGVLPAAGADDYVAPILAGVVLLTAGGVLLIRRRPRSDG